MIIGRSYSWDELGDAFEFKPALLTVGGGMIARPDLNVLLLITHPSGARSFDYDDRWDGNTLIYTGRGKTGDQKVEGPYLDVAENRRHLFVFAEEGVRQLRYLGRATCLNNSLARSADVKGNKAQCVEVSLGFRSSDAANSTKRTESQQPNTQRQAFLGRSALRISTKSNE
jgi:hypothetical protein